MIEIRALGNDSKARTTCFIWCEFEASACVELRKIVTVGRGFFFANEARNLHQTKPLLRFLTLSCLHFFVGFHGYFICWLMIQWPFAADFGRNQQVDVRSNAKTSDMPGEYPGDRRSKLWCQENTGFFSFWNIFGSRKRDGKRTRTSRIRRHSDPIWFPSISVVSKPPKAPNKLGPRWKSRHERRHIMDIERRIREHRRKPLTEKDDDWLMG